MPLLAMTALGDPVTTGRILSMITTRAGDNFERGMLLAHPNTPPDLCEGLTFEGECALEWVLSRPVATAATRRRVLAAATDDSLFKAAWTSADHGPEILQALHTRNVAHRVSTDVLERLRLATTPRCSTREGLMPQCDARSLARVADSVSWRARWRLGGEWYNLRAMARVFVHPNTPASAQATLLRGMRRIAGVDYIARGYRMSTDHIAHTLMLDADLTHLLCTRTLPDLQRWANWDADVAYALTHHAAPLLRPLWDHPDAAGAALALEDTFPGTLLDLLHIAHTVAR